MAKNPIYGFEKNYLEEINKEILPFADQIYYDNFNNLIVMKKPNTIEENTKTILFAFCVSDNAFLVSDIKENGSVVISSLMKYDEKIIGKKAVTLSGKIGYIKGNEKSLECDFGYHDKKAVSRYVKCGDVLSVKPFYEQVGDSFFTNSPFILVKNVFTECMKEYYNKKVIFAFLREQKKGAYALGKSLKCDEAYFIGFSDESKNNISLARKEGSFVSSIRTDKLPLCVTKNDITFASQFYFSSEIESTAGIILKSENIGNGLYRVSKQTLNELKKFIKE